MESENISKSFGPFLKKRQMETRTYTLVEPVIPSADKQMRARAIQGRMSMGKVRFPRFAPWWQDARAQLLKFPNATHDDFVDFLSLFGLGLLNMTKASAGYQPPKQHRTGTIDWILAQTKKQAHEGKAKKASAGW
jgi:hypothetical protein